VRFTIDGSDLGFIALLVNGKASTGPISGFRLGLHRITAVYTGDDLSSTGVLTQRVGKGSTSTALSSSANPSIFGQEVSFTATVSPVAATGTVQFKVDGDDIGGPVTIVAGIATSVPTTSFLSVGLHIVTAIYSGNDNFVGSIAELSQLVVKSDTATVVTSSVNPSVSGQPVGFTATVAPVAPGAGTPTGTVQFRVDGDSVGDPVVLVDGVASSALISDLGVAGHTISADYSGDGNFVASSGTLTQTVDRSATTTVVVSSANPSVAGQGVTFTATVAPVAPGAGTPTGTVRFRVDGDSAGDPVALVAGRATYGPTTSLNPGARTIAADYSGDGFFLPSSGTLTQTVT
jgi:hypothetical protein